MSFFSNLFKSTDYKVLVKNGAVIIDVRTPGEYKTGHIGKSINIPLDSISSQTDRIKKMGKPVITCCASGMRSGSAKAILKSAGIEAHNGGGWTSLNSKL